LEERIETAPRLTRMVRDRIYRSLIVVKLCFCYSFNDLARKYLACRPGLEKKSRAMTRVNKNPLSETISRQCHSKRKTKETPDCCLN
jgi:hypothetical protein